MIARYYLLLVINFGFCLNAYAAKVTVDIQGLDGKLLQNATIFLAIKRSASSELSKHQIKYLHKQAHKQIQKSLQPFGYYQVQVDSQLIPPNTEHSTWQAIYKVDKGDAVHISQIDIQILGSAKQDPDFIQLQQQLPLQQGQQLNHTNYTKAKQAFTKLAGERGYLDAKFTQHELRIKPKSASADIILIFDSGHQYCLDQVIFSKTPFSQNFLNQYIPFNQGDPYLTEHLLDLQNALADSGYFSQVNINTKKSLDKPYCVNVIANLELNKRGNYQTRIGYGTDSKIRVGADVGLRYLNRFGHHVVSSVGLTQNKNKHLAQMRYVIPTDYAKSKFIESTLFYRAEDLTSEDLDIVDVNGETRVTDLSLILGHHRKRNWLTNAKIHEVINLEYLIENYEISPLILTPDEAIEVADFISFFGSPEDLRTFNDTLSPNFKMLILEGEWTYLKTDDPIYSNHGQKMTLTMKGAKQGWGSNVSFWQIRFETEFIRRLHQHGRLIMRTDTAYTNAKTVDTVALDLLTLNANILPKALQFRTGGDNSIRGYEFEEISGGDETLVAGKHLVTASLEYEYHFLPKWSAAIFYDTGNVFNNFDTITFKHSTGIGARWHSPIGLVRVDLAVPLDKDADSSFRFHLVIGPDF